MSTSQLANKKEIQMSTSQLAKVLSRRALWAASSSAFEEYEIGRYRTLRVRVSGECFTDVMGAPLSVEQIQAATDA